MIWLCHEMLWLCHVMLWLCHVMLWLYHVMLWLCHVMLSLCHEKYWYVMKCFNMSWYDYIMKCFNMLSLHLLKSDDKILRDNKNFHKVILSGTAILGVQENLSFFFFSSSSGNWATLAKLIASIFSSHHLPNFPPAFWASLQNICTEPQFARRKHFVWIIAHACIDPRGRPTVTAGSDHYFHTCLSYVRPSLFKI